MTLASAIKSNTLDPRRFLGRPGKKCASCSGIFRYVSRAGGVICETCSPPTEGDRLLRVELRDGVWVETGTTGRWGAWSGAPTDQPAAVPTAAVPTITSPTATVTVRRTVGNKVAAMLHRLKQPLGPEDYAMALDWAERSDQQVAGISAQDIEDALASLFHVPAERVAVAESAAPVAPLVHEQLDGLAVQLTRAVPCFGGTWPVGARFVVTGWAGGPRWNLRSAEPGNGHRGICACRREDFELADEVDVVGAIGVIDDLLVGL
jgi:hypothetical protein